MTIDGKLAENKHPRGTYLMQKVWKGQKIRFFTHKIPLKNNETDRKDDKG